MKKNTGGNSMTNEDRRLLIENTAEMRELKGELREFKEHVMGRVEKLEKKEGDRRGDLKSTLSLLIASGALVVSIIVNFIKGVK
ncbi:hypothetical protein AGMMS49546_33740 [Spirochaetia bacterium]|nr:hypothetical protein AGMMS49546_33740 [Spirochaetia bacterium]